jgi:protein tyrosine kinase modulator
MDGTSFHALDYVSVFNRRKWWFIVPFALAVVGGVALLIFLPKEYISVATIGISEPAISEDLVRSAVPMDREERLRAIEQQVGSLPVLTRVAREEAQRKNKTLDDKALEAAVTGLRINTQVKLPEPLTPNDARVDSFNVSYAGSTQATAQRVANRIAEIFVEEHSKLRAARAEDTTAFLKQQVTASQARLNDLEAQLRKAKEAYMGRLPEQTATNLGIVSGLRQQLESTSIALRGEQDRLSMIERQIETMEQAARAGDEGVIQTKPGEGPLPAKVRVAQLERDLQVARTTYTDKHPEIQRLRDELASAKADAARETADQKAPTRLALLKQEPAYRQLVNDREMARLRVADLRRAEAQARAQIGSYQSRVEAAPMVEQQLAALQRNYDLEKAQYAALVEKHRAAQISANVEQSRAGEQFRILYPASWPTEASWPKTGQVLLVSLLAGLALGAALSVIREYVDRSVHDARSLESEFDLPVLGEIPHIGQVA